MASIDSLNDLLIDELQDIYDAEKRLTKAIPKMSKKATNDQLKMALDAHLGETEQQVERLERAFECLGESAKAKACAGMKGIIEEGDEHVGEDFEDDGLRDAVIIGSAQRVEHYEIAAYGTAIAHAKLLGEDDVVELLLESLNEEKAADEKLTEIAESVVNLDAADASEEGGEAMEDSEEESTGDSGMRARDAQGASGSRARPSR